MCVLIREQGLPPCQSGLPLRALWRVGAAHDIVKGLLIRRDQARARAALNRHVADRHAPFHRQFANGLAAIFDHIACAARRARMADNG